MKRVLGSFPWFLLVCFAVVVAACSKKEEGKNKQGGSEGVTEQAVSPLVGKWVAQRFYVLDVETPKYNVDISFPQVSIVFNNNDTCTIYSQEPEEHKGRDEMGWKGYFYQAPSVEGAYSVNGFSNGVSFNYKDPYWYRFFRHVSLNGKTLELGERGVEGCDVIYVFEKNGTNGEYLNNLSTGGGFLNGGHSNGDGSEGDNGGEDNGTAITNTVVGTIHAVGTGALYDPYAQSIDGKSTTVTYEYYPATGKYYVYGGSYDSNPAANDGKGLRYEAQKGYNTITIYNDYFIDRDSKINYWWKLQLRVTLP